MREKARVLLLLTAVLAIMGCVGHARAQRNPYMAAAASSEQRLAPGSIAAMTPGTSFRDCAECPEMVVIPAGSFVMGSPTSERGRDSTEGPQHRVTIARPFAAARYEVTFDEWDACVQASVCANPGDHDWGRGRQPVIHVSWNHAKQYVQWLSQKTGRVYRLLSEAEWEYVARAGTTTPFSTGASIEPKQANYNATASYAGSPTAAGHGKTVPVGTYPPNAFGLHDIHGNVWEWTEDCGNRSYDGGPTDGKAWISGDCSRRVMRGGAWTDTPEYLRSASRRLEDAAQLNRNLGFRVARTD